MLRSGSEWLKTNVWISILVCEPFQINLDKMNEWRGWSAPGLFHVVISWNGQFLASAVAHTNSSLTLALALSLCLGYWALSVFLLKHAKKEKVNTTKKHSFPFTLICFCVAQTMVKVHPWTQNRKLSTTHSHYHSPICNQRACVREKKTRSAWAWERNESEP